VMHLIAVDGQVGDRTLGVGTIHSDAKPVAASSRSIAAIKILLDVMDVVSQKFYVGAGAGDAYPQWSEPMFGGAVVPNFKALDSHVTLIVNRQYAASAVGGETSCVQDRRLSWIASESNISITRVAGRIDAYQFFVDSSTHIDGTARTCRVCCMLNRAPRCSLGAGIRIIPGRRHVVDGVGLAKSSGDAHE